jgi:hypothetical protein
MANSYFLSSAVPGLAIDIKESSSDPVGPGSPLQAYSLKTGKTVDKNETWTFSPVSGNPGYYQILNAAHNLAIDIKEPSNGPATAGSPLQAYTPTGKANQSWKSVPIANNSTHFWLISADQNFAIDIRVSDTAPAAPGSLLQAYAQKTEPNQHWFVQEATGNNYHPVVNPFVSDIDLNNITGTVTVSGSGFFPGGLLTLQGTFTNSSGVLFQATALYTQADLGGNFSISASLTDWALTPSEPGQFAATIICPQISASPTTATAQWSGAAFSHFGYTAP